MRYIAALGLLFFLTSLTYAQEETVFRHRLNPQTENAFMETCARLSGYPYVRGSFELEKTIAGIRRSLVSSGNFLIAAQLGMVWDTVRPLPSTLTLGRDFIIQSRGGGRRTVIPAHENETFLRMADITSAMFTGNAQGLLDNFDIYYLIDGDSWEMGLVPLDRTVNSFAARIIMKGDTVIRTIQIMERNGDSTRYTLSNHSFGELTSNEQALFAYP